MSRPQKFLLILILLLAFTLRLYRINNPIADWHAFRQADTASVTREYVKHGIDLLHPKYQDLSNIQSGKDNLLGYRMVEFSLVNALTAWFLIKLPFLDLVIFSRLISVFFSLGTILALFYLVKNLSGTKAAFLAALTFAVLPYSVYYSRAILPEPAMLFFSTASLLFFYKYLYQSSHYPLATCYLLLSSVFLALALLLKPFVVFLLPIYLILALQKYKLKILSRYELILWALLSFLPFYLWREWIKNFPSGIPASDWLFNSMDGLKIRLTPAWWRWIFYERLTKLFLGYFGVIFLLANLLIKKIRPDLLVYAAWWAGMISYFIIMAAGNVRHDYYQNLALPIICISVAMGVINLYKLIKNKNLAKILIILIYLLMLWFSWQQVKGYFNINHWEYIEAGQAADKILPPEAKVIAPAMGDTIFLFQTNRTGWPIG